MSNERPQDPGETLIFSCAGAAHCGQVANRAALGLTADGAGKIFCLAAVSAEVPDKFQRTRDAHRRIVIDGCDERCARITMEKAELPVDLHVVVTDLGIEKMPASPRVAADVAKVVAHTRTALDVGTVVASE